MRHDCRRNVARKRQTVRKLERQEAKREREFREKIAWLLTFLDHVPVAKLWP